MAHDDPEWDDIFSSQPGADSGGTRAAAQSSEMPPPSRHAAREQERRARSPRASREPAERKPRRRRRWLGPVIALMVILGLGAGSVAFVWLNFEDQIRKVMGWEIPPEDYTGAGSGEATVIINDGDTGDVIAQSLVDADVVASYEAFYALLLDQDPPAQFYPGYYILAQKMSSQAALDALLDPANRVENTALIKEGTALPGTFEILSAATSIPVADFEAAAADPTAYGAAPEAVNLEGYLFPARYTFSPDVTAESVLQILVDRTFQSLDAAGVAPEDRFRVLTIAALIQREAGSNPDDFYKVSRVIQNRLDEGMLLQFDSTAHYGYVWKYGEREEGGVFSTEAELTDDNPYNTYVHTGLPIGPIAASGDLAMEAAVSPAAGEWLYFVTVNLDTGETKFTNTLAEHNAAVRELQQWCRTSQSPNCG